MVPRGLRGGSWAVLGGSWAALGGSWAFFGGSWGAFGSSLRGLGLLLGTLGPSWKGWRPVDSFVCVLFLFAVSFVVDVRF